MSAISLRRPARAPKAPSFTRRLTAQDGYVLALTGLLIVPLMIFTAFAVDLGAWYAQGSKMQRAADAAALAGVVWLPDQSAATAAAQASLGKDGFPGPICGTAPCFTVSFPTSGTEMQVSFSRPAKQYFSGIVLKSETLTRSGTATFNKPVPLGSPGAVAGNTVAANNVSSNCAQFQPVAAAPCGPQPMLWQAIQGPYETHANGDPYTTFCSSYPTTSGAACGTAAAPANTQYKPEGYEYAIDVPASAVGQQITLEIWDAVESQRTAGNGATNDCNSAAAPFTPGGFPTGFNQQQCQTGDSGGSNLRNGLNMQFQVFANDNNNLTVSFATPLSTCTPLEIARDTADNPAKIATYKNKWATVCTFTATYAGIYPMRVKSSNITPAAGGPKWPDQVPVAASGSTPADPGAVGYNAFSMRLSNTGGNLSSIYALSDLSIWTNTPGSSARFYLAKIGSENKGKKIKLDLFDPGDGQSGTYTMQVFAPPTAAPFNAPTGSAPLLPPQFGKTIPATGVATSCQANTTGSQTKGGGTLSAATNCTVKTRDATNGQIYQDLWLHFEIQIDPNYSCTSDCWWTIMYNFGSGAVPNDRTVWSMTITGDPVHLTN